MYTNVIVGYDGSAQSEDAIALARLVGRFEGARITLAAVYPMSPGPAEHALSRDRQETMLQEARDRLAGVAAGIEDPRVTGRPVGASSPARGLHELAESGGADLVVLGSTHRGTIGRVLMGSIAERLLHGAPCAVAVSSQGYHERDEELGLRVIGVAFDGSPESRTALATAAALGVEAEATLRVWTVAEHQAAGLASAYVAYQETAETIRGRLRLTLEDAVHDLPDSLRAESKLLSGDPATVISGKAEEGVDLLVTGSRGYGPARRVLLGGVSSRLMRLAPCPVLVVPRGVELPANAPDVTVGAGES